MTTYNKSITSVTAIVGSGGSGGSGGGTGQYNISTGLYRTGNVQQGGLVINNSTKPEKIFSITTDGRFTYGTESVKIDDLLRTIKLVKKLAFDVAADPELSKKLPYLKDAAHDWVIDDLKQ